MAKFRSIAIGIALALLIGTAYYYAGVQKTNEVIDLVQQVAQPVEEMYLSDEETQSFNSFVDSMQTNVQQWYEDIDVDKEFVKMDVELWEPDRRKKALEIVEHRGEAECDTQSNCTDSAMALAFQAIEKLIEDIPESDENMQRLADIWHHLRVLQQQENEQ